MKKSQYSSNLIKHTTNDISRKFFISNFYKVWLKTIQQLHPKTILDAGCGEGFTLQKLKEDKIEARLEGIDNSDTAVSIGKKMFPDLNLKTGDIYNLPYNKNSFDLVVCSEVLEHLENPSQALAQIKRVSRKYILLTVPSEPFYMIGRFLRGINVTRFGDHPEHVNHWGVFSFKNFLKSEHVKIAIIKYPFPWIMVLAKS